MVTDKKTEALKLALEALELSNANHWWGSSSIEKAITAIREALAEQPAQQWTDETAKVPDHVWDEKCVLGHCGWPSGCADAAEALAEQPAQQEPVSIKSIAKKSGINLPETYIPTMEDAVAAGDFVLMNEQAALLRECRAALDSLIEQKPTLAGLLCGSTTLGNLKAELHAYRPQGVFGTSPQPSKPWVGLSAEEVWQDDVVMALNAEMGLLMNQIMSLIVWADAKLREKNA